MRETFQQDLDTELSRLRTYARRLDALFRIPGTRLTVGIDNLLGFIPVIGDDYVVTALEELDDDLNQNPNLAIFRQADNGVLVRMALFALIFDVVELVDKYASEVHWHIRRSN